MWIISSVAMTAFQAACYPRSTKPDNRTNRVQTLKGDEDAFVLLFIHISKWEEKSSCVSPVTTTLHKICFLRGLFVIYAILNSHFSPCTDSWRAQDHHPPPPRVLVFIGTAVVIIPGRNKGYISLSYFLTGHVGTIKKSGRKSCTNKYYFPIIIWNAI